MSSNTITISTITSQSLKDKKYLDIFPEYYELAKVTENNPWHDHQNVLDHVIKVFAGLETVLTFETVSASQKEVLERYLSEIIGRRSRKNILTVAILLHDIAKIDTLITSSDGMSFCPGHELLGASRVKNFSERFDFDSKDEIYAERIVRYHGLIAEFLNWIVLNGNKEKYFEIFQKIVGDVAIELVLHMHADILGSDLERLDKKAFVERIEILSWMLNKLIN